MRLSDREKSKEAKQASGLKSHWNGVCGIASARGLAPRTRGCRCVSCQRQRHCSRNPEQHLLRMVLILLTVIMQGVIDKVVVLALITGFITQTYRYSQKSRGLVAVAHSSPCYVLARARRAHPVSRQSLVNCDLGCATPWRIERYIFFKARNWCAKVRLTQSNKGVNDALVAWLAYALTLPR